MRRNNFWFGMFACGNRAQAEPSKNSYHLIRRPLGKWLSPPPLVRRSGSTPHCPIGYPGASPDDLGYAFDRLRTGPRTHAELLVALFNNSHALFTGTTVA